jgi:hypothetical protein
MVQTIFGEKSAQQLRNVPLLNNTVSRQIANISQALEEQLIEVRNKVTDCSAIGQLIAYV